MTRQNWKSLETFEAELLEDDDFRREFEALEPEYQIARTILSARQAIGMSQQALARAIGTSQGRVSRWETAEEVPRLDALKRIANATGIRFQIGIVPDERSPRRRASSGTRAKAAATKVSGSRKQTATKKSSARKKAVARKATARKTSARRSATRKAAVRRKSAARKSAARKSSSRRSTSRRS